MTEDLYADAAPAAPSPSPDKPDDMKESASDSQTAEIPKAVLGGKDLKPGDEVVLQIVQVNEDSAVVKYAEPKQEEEEEAPPQPATPPPQGGGSMASMME